MPTHATTRAIIDDVVPPIVGRDVEVANVLLPVDRSDASGAAAAALLLSAIPGIPQGTVATTRCDCHECRFTATISTTTAVTSGSAVDPQDVDRKFLADTGGCAYIDLNHLEICQPETRSARDHVAAYYAHLRLLREAQQRVNDHLPDGRRLSVFVNNSDGHGHSYGNHLSFLVGRRTYDNLFDHKLHHLLFLASFQVASIVLGGQGKVGAEYGHRGVDYQISQRADFFETLVGPQTTYRRPIVNARDEPLAGAQGQRASRARDDDSRQLARLHVIFYDACLCPCANYLVVGLMQILLVAIAHERIDTRLILDAPVAAVGIFSHDPDLAAQARLWTGPRVTAVDLMRRFVDQLAAFVAHGGCKGLVPDAEAIIELAADTLGKLAARDWPALAGRLDWVVKRAILERVLARRPQLGWDAPQLKHLDHLFSSLDTDEGLFWAHHRAGGVESVVGEDAIARRRVTPPEDTRAAVRTSVLRAAGARRVQFVDWDRVQVVFPSPVFGEPVYRTLWLADPAAADGSKIPAGDGPLSAAELHALLDRLGAARRDTGPCYARRRSSQGDSFYSFQTS